MTRRDAFDQALKEMPPKEVCDLVFTIMGVLAESNCVPGVPVRVMEALGAEVILDVTEMILRLQKRAKEIYYSRN